jgi:hypothetical protein
MKTLLMTITILILTVIGVSNINYNLEPKIKYIDFELPNDMMAITIPPFGIFISQEYKSEGDGPGTILAHEKIHWLQYQELGLIGFYYSYIPDLIRYGRIDHPMEVDARERSK